MIRKEEVFKIGVINKPHGVKGEVSFTFTDDLVPFFMEEYRFRSDNVALVKFEDIDTAEQARKFTNVEVYFPKKFMDEQEDVTSWNGYLGEITDVDDTTINVLFSIEKDGEELLLPAHEEFIIDLDRKKKVMKVDVPDGLIES